MVTRQAYTDDAEMSDINRLKDMHTTLLELKEDPIPTPLTLEFLDPHGHSQILHPDAESRELEDDELEIKELTSATIRCYPINNEETKQSINDKKDGKFAIFSKAY